MDLAIPDAPDRAPAVGHRICAATKSSPGRFSAVLITSTVSNHELPVHVERAASLFADDTGGRSRWQTPSPVACSFVTATRNGLERSVSACVRRESGSSSRRIGDEREFVRRTVCSVNQRRILDRIIPPSERHVRRAVQDTSRTTISNEIIRDLGIC